MNNFITSLEDSDLDFSDWEYILETETGKQMYLYKTKKPTTIQEGLFLEYIIDRLKKERTWIKETEQAVYSVQYVKGSNSLIVTMIAKPSFTVSFFPHQGEREDIMNAFSQREVEDKASYKREVLMELRKAGITSEKQEMVSDGKFPVQIIGGGKHVGRLEGVIRRYSKKKKSGDKWTIVTSSLSYAVFFKKGDFEEEVEVWMQPRGAFHHEVDSYLKENRVLF